MTLIPASQVAQPGKATARTVVQTVIGVLLALGIVVPTAVQIIGQQFAPWLTPSVLVTLGTIAGLAAAISGALARIMAIPQVSDLLTRLGLGPEPPERAEV